MEVNERALRSTGPAYDAQAVTPDDDNDLAEACRSFYVGQAGDVKVTTLKGTTLVIPNASGIINLNCRRFHASGTTATGIVALY